MKPNALLTARRPICQLCEHMLSSRVSHVRRFRAVAAPFAQQWPTAKRSNLRRMPRRPYSTEVKQNEKVTESKSPAIGGKAAKEVNEANERGKAILASKAIPSEDEALEALQACERAARRLMGYKELESNDKSPASALLSLDCQESTTTPSPSTMLGAELISSLAHSILKHPPVFISPSLLEKYVTTQVLLRRPSGIPEIFHLYANKPVPEPSSNPPTYRQSNPEKASSAIPPTIANLALDAAIAHKDLLTALNIIETSFRQRSFHRSKFIRQGLLPTALAASSPLVAYLLATQYALYQNTMSQAMAVYAGTAGIMTYFGIVGTLGFISITTANDHHDRVSWVPGMPMRERWIREEERAAADRVAQAWGFKEKFRRGEEEGWEWEELKEWISVRGMWLDRVALMEGME